jgi:asparagine synthase (glutamine-hydrolysing)
MCGILGIIGEKYPLQKAKTLSQRMSHRGPDERAIHQTDRGYILAHERLSIIDLKTGKQPIQGTNTAYPALFTENMLKHSTYLII